MKRHIFTALSLTLLTSSPITLNAVKKKKDNNKPMSLAAFQNSKTEKPAIAEHTKKEPLALLPFAHEESIPTDEFDKSNTQAQRAALFGAITAIQLKKNKGLKRVDCFHELVRQGKIADLYASEDTHNIKVAASTATQAIDTNQAISRPEISEHTRELYRFLLLTRWQLFAAQAQLASTKEKLKEALQKQEQSVHADVNELPDERGAQRQHNGNDDDDSDGLSVVSSVDDNQSENSLVAQTNENNSASNTNTVANAGSNNNDAHDFENISQDPSDPSTISPVTPLPQPAPTIGGWSLSYLLGYKYKN
jgi:hypothetical protein